MTLSGHNNWNFQSTENINIITNFFADLFTSFRYDDENCQCFVVNQQIFN